MTATATTRIPRGAAPLLATAPASVRRALVRGCDGSWRSAERLLGEMSARQRDYLFLRVRVVSAWWAWNRRKPSGRARFKPGDPRRARLGTQANFLAHLERTRGIVVTPRTMTRWAELGRIGGIGRFIDRRGKRFAGGKPRAAVDAKAFSKLLGLLAAGNEFGAAYESVKAWADERGLAWPGRRTIERRVAERWAWNQRARNTHLNRGVSNN